MKILAAFSVLALAASVCACAPEADNPSASEDSTAADSATVDPALAQNEADDLGDAGATQAPARNDEADDEPAAPVATIPSAVRGRWGLNEADCAGGAVAKGLLLIDATTLRFYESRGTLTEVRERDDSRIRANFAFTGEGMEWTRDEVLDAQDGGRTLIRREYGEGAAPGPFRYEKCE